MKGNKMTGLLTKPYLKRAKSKLLLNFIYAWLRIPILLIKVTNIVLFGVQQQCKMTEDATNIRHAHTVKHRQGGFKTKVL